MGRTYVLNKGTLVLEGITLAQVVELVVKVLVDLASGTVLDEEATENTLAAHPEDLAVIAISMQLSGQQVAQTQSALGCSAPSLGSLCAIPRHSGFLSTLPLTETTVSTDSAGGVQFPSTRTGVHSDGLADDEAIGDEFADGLAGVGVGDLVDLVGVEPDLALSATDNGRRKALLGTEVHPVEKISG